MMILLSHTQQVLELAKFMAYDALAFPDGLNPTDRWASLSNIERATLMAAAAPLVSSELLAKYMDSQKQLEIGGYYGNR